MNTSTLEIEQKIQDLEHQGKDFPPNNGNFLSRPREGSRTGRYEPITGFSVARTMFEDSSYRLVRGNKTRYIRNDRSSTPYDTKVVLAGSCPKTQVEQWVNRFPGAEDGRSVDWWMRNEQNLVKIMKDG